MNLRAMKVEIVVFFAAALLLVFLTFEGIVSNPVLLAAIAAIGFSPGIWELKDSIVSDIPFLSFFFLALLFLTRWRRETVGRAVLAGAVFYLAYGTRSVGLVLPPVLLIDDLIRRRRITRFAFIAGGVFLCCAIVQGALVHNNRSYFQTLSSFHPSTVLGNVRYYVSLASMMWDNGYFDVLRKPLFAATALLATVGFAARVRSGITVFEIAVAGMVAILLLWPAPQGLRFLLPLIPLLLLYTFIGVQLVESAVTGRANRGWGVLCVLILATYGARYSHTNFGPLVEGIAKPQSVEFFRYISTRTPPDEMIVFSKPRALALFAGRRATANHQPATDAELWDFLQKTGARYFAVGPLAAEEERRDYQLRFVERNRARLTPAFSNSDFQVFTILADSVRAHG
jgi:hypothetical protein